MYKRIFLQLLVCVCFVTPVFSAEQKHPVVKQKVANQDKLKPEEFAGELFGVPVPMQNYYFIANTATIFGIGQGQQPKNDQEKQDYIWDQLLLSFESFRRNIEVTPEEVDKEVGKIIALEKAGVDKKIDKAAYEKWVKQKTNEPSEAFENQIRHLLQVQKLRQQVMDSISPAVTDEEARQKFLDQRNTLSVELAQFDSKPKAEEFYKQARRNKDFWEKEKKSRPQDFKRPGFVSLEFLMDIWKFPRTAVFKMMKLKAGDIYAPEPVYQGFAVFKILEIKPANDKEFAEKVKESYYEQIKGRKKFDGMNDWFNKLKSQANIKINKTGGVK